MSQDNWKALLEQYLGMGEKVGVDRAPPVGMEECRKFVEAAKERGMHVDPAVVELLQMTNGTGFDSLRFYGVDIEDHDRLGRLDFLAVNDLVEERGADTLYGEWQDEFFVYVHDTGTFARRSISTWDIHDEYPRCPDLLAAVLRSYG